MNREDFLRAHPIEIELEARGVRVIGGGNQRTAKCPLHEDRTASMSINVTSGLWNCHAGCGGGSVIDLISRLDGISPGDVLKRNGNPRPAPVKQTTTVEPKFETVCTYDYLDGSGELVYQVVRQHAAAADKPCGYVKTFRQRQPDSRGGWVYNMDGAMRVLYRLPQVLQAKTVWVVEGEKDADTLCKHGFTATCNVGGAGKWMDGYTVSLEKRNVAICGDNDETGKKHAKQVFDSVAGKAKTVRMIRLPSQFKDITEYCESFKSDPESKLALHALYDSAVPFVKGVSLPVFRVSELEDQYSRHVQNLGVNAFDLSKWLPSLKKIRALVPGEFVLILGATGIGKTAALSNIAVAASPMPTLFFELELPPELMYERLVALRSKVSCVDVEAAYKAGETLGDGADKLLSHLFVCTQARLKIEDIENIIIRSELKIGERPRIILVDYVGLIAGIGKSRYERVSQIAEDLKTLAKTTRTIVIAASQVNRDSNTDENPEISLNAGKDSGSLENSSGLVLGLWRDPKDPGTAFLEVLKATKGGAGTQITCNYHIGTLAITERSQIQWP